MKKVLLLILLLPLISGCIKITKNDSLEEKSDQIVSEERLFEMKKECSSLKVEIQEYLDKKSEYIKYSGTERPSELKIYYSPVLNSCIYTYHQALRLDLDKEWAHEWPIRDYLNDSNVIAVPYCWSDSKFAIEEECYEAKDEVEKIIEEYTRNNNYAEITWMGLNKKSDGSYVVEWSFEDGRYKHAWICYEDCKMKIRDKDSNEELFEQNMPTKNGCDTWFNVSKENSKIMDNVSGWCASIDCGDSRKTEEFCWEKVN